MMAISNFLVLFSYIGKSSVRKGTSQEGLSQLICLNVVRDSVDFLIKTFCVYQFAASPFPPSDQWHLTNTDALEGWDLPTQIFASDWNLTEQGDSKYSAGHA